MQSRVSDSCSGQSSPLQHIKSIEQSLQVLQGKLSQMHKQQSENVKQIQKVFYSSIPLLKNKLSQSMQFQKFQQKKKNNFNEKVLRQRRDINRQRKMINEKEIQRNRELINIMKMNEHNSIKQLSRKNELYIQKMKNQRLEENKRKKQFVRTNIENSRMKILNFHQTKKQQLKRVKEEQNNNLQKRVVKMFGQLGKLSNKENQTHSRVEKSSEALKQLKYAVNKLEKMNQQEFLKLRSKVIQIHGNMDDESILQKILSRIIQTTNFQNMSKKSQTLYNSKLSSGELSRLV